MCSSIYQALCLGVCKMKQAGLRPAAGIGSRRGVWTPVLFTGHGQAHGGGYSGLFPETHFTAAQARLLFAQENRLTSRRPVGYIFIQSQS